MKNISEIEQEKYSDIWSLKEYASESPGEQMVDLFMSIARPKPFARVIDVGCGAGAGSLALKRRGLSVYAMDLTDTAWKNADEGIPIKTGSIWHGIPYGGLFDYAYCTDMMEHIPTQFVALTIQNILAKSANAFFSISFSPDNFGHYIKQDLHLTVKPFTWWRDTLRELGTVEEARDMIGEGVFYVKCGH